MATLLSTVQLGQLIINALPSGSPLLSPSFIGLAYWQWVTLVGLIVFSALIQWPLRVMIQRLAQRLSGARIMLEEAQLRSFATPMSVALAWLCLSALLSELMIAPDHIVYRVTHVVCGMVISIGGGLSAWRFVDVLSHYLEGKAALTQNKFDDMLVPLARRMLKILVVALCFGYFLSILTDDVYKVVAGLSIGSAVLMFAFKDSLENVFGTFTVLMDKPFQLGDWITVDDVDGTVERVGFRSTRVRTFYHSVITVPNRHFISAKVDNWGSRRFRRVKTTLGLTYDTPPEKIEAFCEAVRELIRHHPYTRKDYYHVYFNDFGASSLDVMLYCFLDTPDWSMELRERHRLFADILTVAEELKVSFAFPSTSLYMVSSDELIHEDRPADAQEGKLLGRALGERVAAETMKPYGDNKPGKVKFVQQNSPLASPGGEGDG